MFAQRYPAIHAHFEKYRQGMIDRYDQGKFFWELRACAYWQEFEQPKIIVPAITDTINYAPDITGYYSNDKTSILVSEEWRYLLAILNSPLSWWVTQQTFASKQGGFFEFKPMYVSQVPIPAADAFGTAILNSLVDVVIAGVAESRRFEQLINGLVCELFFPDDLHQINIHLFDACEKEDIGKLTILKDKLLANASAELATRIFTANHQIYGMLHDLQGLPVVRLIEGHD